MKLANKATLGIVLALTGLVAADAGAQLAGGPYRLEPVIAGGGGVIANGGYELRSTIGQPATATLAAGPYRLFSGFWSPADGAMSDVIFRNGFEP